MDEARELVPGAAVVAVSAKTGEGLDELRTALVSAAGAIEHHALLGATRLYVDRAFTLHGIGTVVTGTLWSGSVGEGDELRAEPAGIDVRVRSVQVHDEPVERAEAGQRVALALPGHRAQRAPTGRRARRAGRLSRQLPPRRRARRSSSRSATTRGCTCITGRRRPSPGSYESGSASRSCGSPLRWSRRATTASSSATRTTLGGGRILDPAPPRAPDPARLELLATDDPVSIVKALVHEPVRTHELAARALLSPEQLDEGLESVGHTGEWYFAPDWLEQIEREVRTRLMLRAEATPLDPGLSAAELLPGAPWADAVLPLLDVERRNGKVYLPGSAAELGERGAGGSGARGEARRGGTHARGGRRRRARSLSRGVRPARADRRRPGDWPRNRTRRRSTSSSTSASAKARSRSPGSATSSVSPAGRPSCCSSASTRTA